MRSIILAAVTAVSLAALASPASAAVTMCHTDTDLRGADAVAAIRGTCRPGDVVTFRRGPSTCAGARCTMDGSVDALCDRRQPIVSGYYAIVSCTLRAADGRHADASRASSVRRR